MQPLAEFSLTRLLRRAFLASAGALLLVPVAPAVETPDIPLPGSFAGAYLAARTAETDGDMAAASALYAHALMLNDESQPVRQALMLSLLSKGALDEAVPHAEILKNEPDIDRIARLVLGVDAIRNKQFSKAKEALALASPSDLDRLIFGLLKGWADVGAGKPLDAISGIEALTGPDWYVPFKQIHAAFMADAGGLADKAAAAYEKAFAAEESLQAAPDAYLSLIEAYARFAARRGENARAFEVLQKGEEIAPNRPTFAAIREGVKAGTPLLPHITDAAQGAAEVLFTLAMAINREGAEPFVERYLRLAQVLAPGRDMTLYELGRLAEKQNRTEEAAAFFGEIADSSSLHRLARMQQALSLTDLKRDEEAKTILRAMIAENPAELRPYIALASIFNQAKDYESAATLFDEAALVVPETAPDYWNLHYQRGIAREHLKQWDKAEPAFRKALEIKPDHPDVLNYLGYSFIDRNLNLDEALNMVRRAVELQPDSGYIIDSLGWAYFRLGKVAEAIVELERAIAIMPGDAVINDHLGDAYWAAGRKLEARFQWNHALAAKPEPAEERKIRAKIDNALKEEAAAKAAHLAAFEKAQAAAPAKPAETGAAETVTVSRGESLWLIAKAAYGDGARYTEILAANPALKGDPQNIEPGQVLVIPR